MSKQEPLLGTNLMPKEPALLVRVMLTLLPILIASGIGFNVYLTQQIASLDKRVTSTESWRDSHDKRVPELLAQVAKERDDADRSYQTATLRQGVEWKALATCSAGVRSYRHSGLVVGVTNWYRLRAYYTGGGYSAFSEAVPGVAQ